MPLCKDITKDREICFSYSQTGADPAEKAVQLLVGLVGIELATSTRSNVLRVRYDVREITLQMLESALCDVGFALHDSMTIRIKREVIAYCEGALRSSLGIETDKQQQSLSLAKPASYHNNLDPRPDHWRNYS